MDKKYYVYVHRDHDGVVFYVGKGSGDRYKRKNYRSTRWHEAAKDGFTWEIVKDCLSNSEALDYEEEMISLHRKTVVNRVESSKTRELDYEFFNKILYYDESSPSGLRWKVDRISKSGSKILCADKVVGWKQKERNGNFKGWGFKIGRVNYPAHRIIWLLLSGELDSDLVVDHKDGNPLNNKKENLRLKTQADNSRNRRATSSSSGVGQRVLPSGVVNYTAYWTINGVLKSKTFASSKYGHEEAFKMAREVRETKIKELIALGFDYTDRHLVAG